MIDWSKGTIEDEIVASDIAQRFIDEIDPNATKMTIVMDIMASHTNGCKLKLEALRDSKLSDFVHDVCGINKHIDRETGKLLDCFLPRYAA